ncbi:MAG: DegT/DnrJ/EryC1/StrS family aminotransferase [Candidatus Omnitrophica bacterium]|nr:DegT/DnrJ/EryC1/StrS family aminotransferase [Candidatus Omnitrophota bacterium]
MIIEKKQSNQNIFAFKWNYFSSAREGLKHILSQPQLRAKKILLPAYIGYSTREGSGVFDPVAAAGTPYVFYHMDRSLNIDLPSLTKSIRQNPGQMLMLIHYFGFIDKHIDSVKKLARAYKMVLIEDFAHAFYTFYNDPSNDFDYAIFSLHKMFPRNDGGMVLSDRDMKVTKSAFDNDLFRYNLPLIAQRRRKNYTDILKVLRGQGRKHDLRLLRPVLGRHVPQTFPVILPNRETRDRLYFSLNEAGFGAVSLYHQLIDQIDESFIDEHAISNTILNLPVHQDILPEQLDGMLKTFFLLLKKS